MSGEPVTRPKMPETKLIIFVHLCQMMSDDKCR